MRTADSPPHAGGLGLTPSYAELAMITFSSSTVRVGSWDIYFTG
jgi:hypothetical protein